jgi:cell division protein ZapE
MREVHRELAQLQGTVNPLDVLGAQIAERYKLICFDEFHVADITDAMILHRLLQSMFDHGVGFVTTSNFKPDDLYPDGLHRDRILPAIDLLNAKLEVINVDNGTDYRRRTLERVKLYHTPLGREADTQMDAAFSALAECQDEAPVLQIEHREIRARRKAGGVVWFDFRALCAGPRSQNDYLELASQFHTVLLSDVPQMSVNMASEARRFTWLVDVLYDRRVKLILSAAVPPEALYTEGALSHEFPRTVSRLNEMQSAEFMAQERRVVDTRLTTR